MNAKTATFGKMMVGSSTTIHMGFKRGTQWTALCGAGANRTGINKSAFGYPIEDVHAVTCKNCIAKAAKIHSAEPQP